MEFEQNGDYLYCIGGYGYSATVGDHTTYDKLTAINVPEVIQAIINGIDITPHFRQITDTMFQVTGGHLNRIADRYYLLGGQKFLGRYNPMGPTHGPGFIQEYTDAIRIFSIEDDGNTIEVTHISNYKDSVNLHRRDYNAVSQIMPNGEEGVTMFSGVFQHEVDLPFLNCVNVDADGYTVNDTFQQYYNHYHCAFMPAYEESENQMHTVFFGGIAQFYDDGGVLVQDNDVPFVKTIARVTRDSNGSMTEYKMPLEMPNLLGASAEFIHAEGVPSYPNEVLRLDDITADTTLVGYIFGGINSTEPNIFFINDGTQSEASSTILKVFLIKNPPVALDEINESSIGSLNMTVFPNPSDDHLQIHFKLEKPTDVQLTIRDAQGAVILRNSLPNQSIGSYTIEKYMRNFAEASVYFITIETEYERSTKKILVNR